MTRLAAFGPELWTAEGPVVSFYGFAYPTRMAVIRLDDGTLFVWSPVALDAELKSEVERLGPVRHLVAPNKLHHLSLTDWKRAFPTARLWAPPGLARKRRDLSFDGALTGVAPADWRGQIEQVMFDGSLLLTEIVFFHRASSTVLFADLIQRFPAGWFSGWRGWVARLDGIVAPDYGPPREWRLSFINRAAPRRARAQLLSWQPRNAIIAHGAMARGDGAAFINRALAWL